MVPDNTVAGDKRTILVVEDEPGIGDLLDMGLRSEGYAVHIEVDGIAGLHAFRAAEPALVILDVMLPGLDGMEVCRQIRAESQVPIIMLTAMGEVESKIAGLSAGADDYIAKPFRFDELLARVRAVLRRSEDSDTRTELSFADLRLSVTQRKVTRAGRTIELTAREFDLLAFLMRHPREVVAKDALLKEVWGYEGYGDANVVEVYVRYVRQKLGDAQLIQTVRGVGYVLRRDEA